MSKVKNWNRHQKRAFKAGEKCVSGDEIWRYVELSRSEYTKDRLEAAKNLCPCHVRRRIDEVWDALYRMIKDPDVEVRRPAYHTLQDCGKPDDPRLERIFEEVWENESDRQIRGFVKTLSRGREQRERIKMNAATISKYTNRGKCDFCGTSDTAVRTDFDTEIPGGGARRLALICETCDS
jgi:hypothetical protein